MIILTTKAKCKAAKNMELSLARELYGHKCLGTTWP